MDLKKSYQYAVYKKLILDPKKHPYLKWGGGKFTMLMDIKIKLGWKPLYQINFNPKTIIKDEEGHYIILKGSVQQEDLTILNIYPQRGSSQLYKPINNKIKETHQQ